jgi:thiamine pyrophosphate-dependent acetolactate synthase large subunit-like protein
VTGKVSEFCPHAKVIHVDIDPTSIRKNIHVDIPIVGDCKTVLRELEPDLESATVNGEQKTLRKAVVGSDPRMGTGSSLDLSAGEGWTHQAAACRQAAL